MPDFRTLEELAAANAVAKRAAQTKPAPAFPGVTLRDLANALVLMSVRNGYIEELHAGRWSPALTDPSVSRITDAEMKKLMIGISADLALRLDRLFNDPLLFAEDFDRARKYTRNWEREEITYDPAPEPNIVAKCSGCGGPLASDEWRFCPACGAGITHAI